MARPQKNGLDYFPFDVDFFEDEKIQAIAGEFGIKGELVAVKLLCAIYRNGYYIQWSDLIKNKLLRNLPGVSAELLDTVVNRLVKWGFFHEPLFTSDGVLTSNGIQKRFIEATKRRKTELLPTYCIHKPSTNGVNANINPQSKVKKSKGKNIGTNVPVKTDVLPTDAELKILYKSVIISENGDLGEFIRTNKPEFPEPYAALWNKFAVKNGFPKIEKLNDHRKRKLITRLKDESFDLSAILDKAVKSEGLKGSAWFTFDWVIENDNNFLKVLEGNYEKKIGVVLKEVPKEDPEKIRERQIALARKNAG